MKAFLYTLAAVSLTLVLGACANLPGGDGTGELKSDEESPADLYVKLAVEYLRDGQIETALSKVEKGLKEDRNNADAHNVIALIYRRLGQDELAEEHFRDAVRLDGQDPFIRNAWGSFLCERGDYDEAQTQFERALDNPLYPTPAVALTNSGMCAERAGSSRRAEEQYRRALSANPRFAPAMLKLAELDYRNQRYKSASAYLERFFKASRPTPAALLLGVRVERKAGSRKRANAYAKMLRTNFPDSPEIIMLNEL